MLKRDWWFWLRLGHESREQKQIRDQSKRERNHARTMKSAQPQGGSSREKKMTIFPHLWGLIPRCLCIRSVLFIANTQAVYFFLSDCYRQYLFSSLIYIYIPMCIYLQPYMIIKVCMPNEIYPYSFSFFFWWVGGRGGGGGGGGGGWGTQIICSYPILHKTCSGNSQTNDNCVNKITILSFSAIFTGPIATMR